MREINTKQAIDLLSKVPEEEFITGIFTDGRNKCCAIGHLMRLTSADPDDYTYNNCSDRLGHPISVREASEKFIHNVYNQEGFSIADVNNTFAVNGYTEETPKARVLHLLRDMNAAGF